MRIYLPATVDELGPTASALSARRAHAVTAALRAALPDEDQEGLEYAAQLAAADDSLDLLRARSGAPRLRVVVSVDVPEHVVASVTDDGLQPSVVELVTGVALDDVVCVHVDEPAARRDVDAALAGQEGAMDRLDERDLLWYDATELGQIPH